MRRDTIRGVQQSSRRQIRENRLDQIDGFVGSILENRLSEHRRPTAYRRTLSKRDTHSA